MNEIWKEIRCYEKKYEISNLGNVRSLDRKISNKRGEYFKKGQKIKKQFTTTGYYKITLWKDNIKKDFKVHRLVAYHFIGTPPIGKEIINHKDGDPLNNNVKNLEWCNQRENVEHALRTGLRKSFKINKEELKKDLKIMSLKQIAEKHGTTEHTIMYNVNKFKLQGKVRIYKTGITPEILKAGLSKMNQTELAKGLKCTQGNISHMLSEFKRRGLL